jgi:hypothetical protein
VELYARDEYGDRNNFRFAFFDDEFNHEGELIDRYRRIRLRNGGTDRLSAFIRDELSQVLFRQAGHSTTQTHRPAAVFLNGEYYGVAWLKSPRTPNHLVRVLGGGVTDNFEFVEGGDRRLQPGWWQGEPRGVTDISELFELARSGFTGTEGEARFQEFSRRVDVDDLIRYYAMQVYINNLDWPNHNMELWRYFPTEEEKNDPNLHPYLRDGRWRVFAHDIEAAWGIWDGDGYRNQEDTLHHILTGTGDRWNSSGSSAFLHAFVDREDTREQLANVFIELIEGVFSAENVIRTLDGLVAQIENEHSYALRMDAINPGSIWWPTTHSTADHRDGIRRFAEDRPAAVREMVRRHLR